MKFSEIPGHDDVKKRLRDMADRRRIPHAVLLEGPVGSGKFCLARAFAQYVHCEHPVNGDSCGVCSSCRQHQDFNNIDTFYSFPVVKKSGKSALSDDYIQQFRDFITEYPFMDMDRWLEALDNINAQPQIYVEEGNELLRRLNFKARQSDYKIVLLWLPERLKEETANKLLKLVEEPYPDTIFVMVSNNSRQILPTIYSRTQRIFVRRYEDAEVADILVAKGFKPELAVNLARISQGNVNDALKLAGVSKERLKYLDLFAELMRKAYNRRVADLKVWSNDVAALGREPIMQFLDYSAGLLRENLMLHISEPQLITLNQEEHTFCSRFFPFVNERNVLGLFDVFNNAKRYIAANGNAKIVLFDSAIKVIMLLRR